MIKLAIKTQYASLNFYKNKIYEMSRTLENNSVECTLYIHYIKKTLTKITKKGRLLK